MAKLTEKASANGKMTDVPDRFVPEVAQALLEDAVLTAAADLAATLAESSPDTLAANALAPEAFVVLDDPGLDGVPYLGPVRRQALTDAGIVTRADLHNATQEQIGGVKGVGNRIAELIKEWLATQAALETADEVLEESVVSEAVLTEASQIVQDDLAEIDSAVSRIKKAIPKKDREKGFERQLVKILFTVSEVPESFESLSRKDQAVAAKALDRIARLLAATAERGRLSEKKQSALRLEIRERRKRLEQALDA